MGALVFLRHVIPARCQAVICFPLFFFFFFPLRQKIPIIRMNSLLSPLEFGGKNPAPSCRSGAGQKAEFFIYLFFFCLFNLSFTKALMFLHELMGYVSGFHQRLIKEETSDE